MYFILFDDTFCCHFICTLDEARVDLEIDSMVTSSSKVCHKKVPSPEVSKVTTNEAVSCVDDVDGETCRVQVNITGMSCSSCVNKIESSLSSKNGKKFIH